MLMQLKAFYEPKIAIEYFSESWLYYAQKLQIIAYFYLKVAKIVKFGLYFRIVLVKS